MLLPDRRYPPSPPTTVAVATAQSSARYAGAGDINVDVKDRRPTSGQRALWSRLPPSRRVGESVTTSVITGAGGFVGPHLASHLEAEGDEVLTLDLHNGPDLLDGPAWGKLLGETSADVIYHLAGWSDVGGSWRNPQTTFEVNVMGTVNLLEAARTTGVDRVIVVSSADVYGPIDDDQPIEESRCPRPTSPYGASKQAVEAIAQQYWHGHGLETIVARPFNHIGPGQRPDFVAPAFASQIASLETAGGGTIRHGNLSAKRDFTDVRDVVRAYRLLADRGAPGETYNICSGQARTMQSLLETLLARSATKIEPEVDPERMRPVDQPVIVGSAAKLTSATGWQPSIDFETSLADVLDDARRRISSPSTAS